uniref:Pepsin-I3 domain-containing protein n=1 Tax=Anisakis simplex TaxID=6269 RepID=A0A0M3JEU6_ANISI
LFLAIGLCPLFFTSGELREYFLYGITNGPFACHINGTQVFLDDLNFANLSSEAEMQEADNYMKRLEDCERQVIQLIPIINYDLELKLNEMLTAQSSCRFVKSPNT